MKLKKCLSVVLGFCLAVVVSSCASTARVEVGRGAEVSPVLRDAPQPSQSPDVLRLRIQMTGDGGSVEFARRFDTSVRGRILCPEVKMEERGEADFLLTYRPQVSLFDQTGENYLYTCDVELSLKDSQANRTYGTETLSLKGKREFGQANALAKLAEQVAAAAAEWSNRQLRQVAGEELAATKVSVVLPKSFWEKMTSRDELADSGRLLAVAEELLKLQGVLTCTLDSVDRDFGVATFRIVYFRKQYPAGVLDAANTAIANADLN